MNILEILEETIEKWERMKLYAVCNNTKKVSEEFNDDCPLCCYSYSNCRLCPIHKFLGYWCGSHEAYNAIKMGLPSHIDVEDINKCIKILNEVLNEYSDSS